MKYSFADSAAVAMKENLDSEKMKNLFHNNYVVKQAQNTVEDQNLANDKAKDDEDDNCAKDHDHEKDKDDCGDMYADDVNLALDTAVANLITASAALDAVGFEKSASLSLQIANFVSEAKAKKKEKKDKKDMKAKKDSKDTGSKKDPKKDSAKDKKDSKSTKDSKSKK